RRLFERHADRAKRLDGLVEGGAYLRLRTLSLREVGSDDGATDALPVSPRPVDSNGWSVSRGRIVGIGPRDRLEDQPTIVRAPRDRTDLVQGPGADHAAGAAHAPIRRAKSRHA